ncbi:MAG: cyclase family protein [Myxococcaceae bacterium]|nr:cyclase family protein [Myxococcaceae bacterium]
MKRAMRRMMLAGLGLSTACATTAGREPQQAMVERSRAQVPTPPWPAGDERGMANTQGRGTWLRCAWHLNDPNAKVYELAHVSSNTMPMSPFAPPLSYQYRPSAPMPGTRHVVNGEILGQGDPSNQGTQFDGLGHFGVLPEPWSGQGPVPEEAIQYFGGFQQKDVKPTPDSPLLKLGMDKVPPIITEAVLLDARSYLGKGQPLKPGQLITAQDIEGMLQAQGLGWRGLLPGDVLYVYTGWEENWADPEGGKGYYKQGPGLSYDAAKYLGEKAVTALALDAPFLDPVIDGQLEGKVAPTEGTPPGLPFSIHHQNLTQSGVHHVENAHLAEMAADKVWTSCTMILPLRIKGAATAQVRPVAVGAPASR